MASPYRYRLGDAATLTPDEGRIWGFLASRNYIREVDEDSFAANKLSRTLALEEFNVDIQMK